jgi:glucosamine--fructose-6-phosphate aminotransferase (isomerizing)
MKATALALKRSLKLSPTAALMGQEILEQPDVCARLFSREAAGLAGLVKFLRRKKPQGIVLAARGSSDHAATYGRYLLEYLTGIPTHLAAPSLITLYGRKVDFRNYFVIGVSQSGQGPDINAVLAQARSQGALTLGITNDLRSGLARASRHVLGLGAGREASVAATKTFTSELAGLALLGVLWTGRRSHKQALQSLPARMELQLKRSQEPARHLAASLQRLKSCAVLGRGFQMGVAHEIALKMKECAGVPALSYSLADFAHGPISLAKNGFPVFLVGSPGKMEASLDAMAADLLRRGAKVYRLGLSKRGRSAGALCFEDAVPEIFSPLLTILPGQWLAYYNALAKGLDPAVPKGLNKVTKTR